MELRADKKGWPDIDDDKCGENFAAWLGDHAAVDTGEIMRMAREQGEEGIEERFILGVANVGTHEVAHGPRRHVNTHHFMLEGGAKDPGWLFDPSLTWSPYSKK